MRDMTPLHGWVIAGLSLTTMTLLAQVDPIATGRSLYHVFKDISIPVIVSLPHYVALMGCVG